LAHAIPDDAGRPKENPADVGDGDVIDRAFVQAQQEMLTDTMMPVALAALQRLEACPRRIRARGARQFFPIARHIFPTKILKNIQKDRLIFHRAPLKDVKVGMPRSAPRLGGRV
jgi:hypothetical protein